MVTPSSRGPSSGRSVDVEVLAGDTWHPGVLRDWQRRDGGWWANVAWTRAPGDTRLDVFPEAAVRQVKYCPWWRGSGECMGWEDCGITTDT